MSKALSLSRRRLIGGIGTIVGASAASGAGTMAYFSDSETSSDNSIQAGTLDLTLDEKDRSITFLNAENIAPGDGTDGTEYGDVDLHNAGTIDGNIDVELTEVRNYDKKGNRGQGDLRNHLEVKPELDGVAAFDYTAVADLDPAGGSNTVLFSSEPLDATASKPFKLYWRLPQSTPNKVKGERLELDLAFQLTQNGGT